MARKTYSSSDGDGVQSHRHKPYKGGDGEEQAARLIADGLAYAIVIFAAFVAAIFGLAKKS